MNDLSMIELGFVPKRAGGDFLRVEDFLSRSGIGPEEFVYAEPVRGKRKLFVYFESGEKARRISALFKKEKPAGWDIRERLLEKADWLTKWQTAYRITPMGKKFSVVPLWRRHEFSGRRIPVYMNPRASFGSGTHDTTRFVVGLIETLEGKLRSFLDVGTGTGILLVAAARMGSRKNIGVDLDREALVTARENLELNGVRGRLARVDIMKKAPAGTYDLVAANLFSSMLVEVRGRLAACVAPGGHLAVSGIEKQNFSWFLRNFKHPSLRRLRTFQSRRWSAALFKKMA